MTPRHILRFSLLTFCLVGSNCSPKQEPPATKQASSEGNAAESSESGTEKPTVDDLANFPITVKLGPDGRALPVASVTGKNPTSMVAGMRLLSGMQGQMMLGGKTSASGRIWHVIDRSKGNSKGAGTGAKIPDTYQVGPDGAKTQTDAFGDQTTWNKDGSTDMWSRDGSHTHMFPKGKSPGDMYGYRDNPDESRTDFMNNGSTRRTTKEGDTIEENLPDNAEDNDKGQKAPPSGKPPGDKPAGASGDPHYLTRDGAEFSTQAAGEFVLVRGSQGREIQVRQSPFQNNLESSVGVISALAFRVGESKVEARLDGTVLINGEASPNLPAMQGNLPGGGAVGVWREGTKLKYVVVLWPDLSTVWVSVHEKHLDALIQWKTLAPEHRGLLGSNDEKPENDLLDRQGNLANPADEASVSAFVESWRITNEESLFTYAAGESTANYTIKGFPKSAPTGDREAAVSAAAGVPEGFAREKCIFDVMATGDVAFVKSYTEFGNRLAALRNHARLDKPSKEPKRAADELQLTEAERKGATELEAGATIKKTLAAGETVVYRFNFNDPNSSQMGVLSNALEGKKPYSPDTAGYALFDETGKAVSQMTQATNDLPPAEMKQGSYFLKIFGPGPVDIKLH